MSEPAEIPRPAGEIGADLRARAARNLAAMRGDASHPWAGNLAAALEPRSCELTEQERRVLSAASFGMTSPMIAELLGISVETARTHKAAIRGKCGAKNTAHAVAIALRAGAIQ